jgi:putative ABC transport system permease protein
MWADYFMLAVRTFTHQKKRTLLTLIGIVIGISAVVSLISLGQGLSDSIDKQFEAIGSNRVFVQAGGGGSLTTNKLTDKDLRAIEGVNGVDSVGTAIFKMAKLKYGKESKFTFVIGVDSGSSGKSVLETFGAALDIGRDIEGDDDVLLGYDIWGKDFFNHAPALGDKVSIEGKRFTFVGGAEKLGNPNDDSQVYLSVGAAKKVFNISDNELDYILVTVKDGVKPSDVADRIKKALRKTRDVEKGDEDFSAQTSEEIIKTFGTVLTIIQIILISIAAISLLVGGVNIMNTMYTSVLERTNEIGIMKAIGAQNKDIFFVFLIESGILGLVGGIVGIGLGIGMSKLVAYGAAASGWSIISAVFPLYLLIGAFLFSFVVGAAAGTLPAIQASKLKPVDALRYE